MQRAFAISVSALMLVPLTASWRQPDIAWQVHALVGVIMALTAIQPRWGVLTLAGLFPLAPALGAIFADGACFERMLLAFLVPAGLHLAADRRAPAGLLIAPGSLLAALILASGLLPLSVLAERAPSTASFLAALWAEVSRSFFPETSAFPALHVAWQWLEAIGLAVFLEIFLRREQALLRPAVRLMLMGTSALAFFSLNRVIEQAIREPSALNAIVRAVRRTRFNPFYTDLNAAASMYALVAIPAIWLAWKGRRSFAWPAALLLTLAAWFAGSRAALASVVVAIAGLTVIATRPSKRTLAQAAGILLAGLLVFAVVSRRNAPASVALSIRADLTVTALAITARAPIFGVGLDQFLPAARNTLSAEMKARHNGFLRNGENAHNNFLQILAELGIFGLGAFLWFLAPVSRGLQHQDRVGPEAVALTGGIGAFLLTCVLGHPLLVDHVRAMFFLIVGMAVAVTATTLPPPAPGPWRRAVPVLALVAIAAGWPARVSQAQRQANFDGSVLGASEEMDPAGDGVVFRIAEPRSSWFVSGRARSVEIPLRLRSGAAGTCLVTVTLDGHAANTVTPTSEIWTPLRLQLPPTDRRSRRLDLEVGARDCILMVGRPSAR